MAEKAKAKPTGVKADKSKRVLTITWSNGRSCDYPFAGLRAICPCVTCKGGHDNMGGPPDLDLLHNTQNDDLMLEAINQVGGYALQLVWNDGHDTGIYTWAYLRQACG